MRRNGTLKIVAAIVASLLGLAGAIVVLAQTKLIGFELAMLMLVALVGLYVGFGILIVVYRFTRKLE